MWFTLLEPGSISNFNELSAVFLKQYSILMDKSILDTDLWNLSQGPNETLRAFITKFKSVLLKLPRIHKSRLYWLCEKDYGMIRGLRKI